MRRQDRQQHQRRPPPSPHPSTPPPTTPPAPPARAPTRPTTGAAWARPSARWISCCGRVVVAVAAASGRCGESFSYPFPPFFLLLLPSPQNLSLCVFQNRLALLSYSRQRTTIPPSCQLERRERGERPPPPTLVPPPPPPSPFPAPLSGWRSQCNRMSAQHKQTDGWNVHFRYGLAREEDARRGGAGELGVAHFSHGGQGGRGRGCTCGECALNGER